MIGEEIEVGVKLGYIKALFSLSKVTLKQVPAGSAAITSSRYNIWSRGSHNPHLVDKILIPFVSSHTPGPQSCLCHLHSVSWGRGMSG